MTVADAINGFRDEGWIFVRNNHTVYEDFLQMIRSLDENQFTTDLHVSDLLVFPQGTNFYTHPCYQDGSIILQDKVCTFNNLFTTKKVTKKLVFSMIKYKKKIQSVFEQFFSRSKP